MPKKYTPSKKKLNADSVERAAWHLTFEGVVGDLDTDKLSDLGMVQTFLLEIHEKMGVPLVADPNLVPRDDGGVFGFVLDFESHVVVRTWPDDSRFSLDVVSCREVDMHAVDAWLMERMRTIRRSSHVIQRIWL